MLYLYVFTAHHEDCSTSTDVERTTLAKRFRKTVIAAKQEYWKHTVESMTFSSDV